MLKLIATAAGLFALAAGAGSAQAPNSPHITVVGVGEVETPPAFATINYTLVGEGPTTQAATEAFSKKRAAVEAQLGQMGADVMKIHTRDVSVLEARGKDCDGGGYRGQAQLSVGNCAVKGYVARADFTLDVTPPTEAGNMAANASRLGASDARAGEYRLEDVQAARAAASAKAYADARRQAEALASSSGSRLGELISVQDAEAREGDEVVVTGTRRNAVGYAPVSVVGDLRPAPIKTTVRLTVVFALTH